MAELPRSTTPPRPDDLPPPPMCCDEPMKLMGVVRPFANKMGLLGYDVRGSRSWTMSEPCCLAKFGSQWGPSFRARSSISAAR